MVLFFIQKNLENSFGVRTNLVHIVMAPILPKTFHTYWALLLILLESIGTILIQLIVLPHVRTCSACPYTQSLTEMQSPKKALAASCGLLHIDLTWNFNHQYNSENFLKSPSNPCFFYTHRIHVWYIYLYLPYIEANVGKYTIHGSYGIYIPQSSCQAHQIPVLKRKSSKSSPRAFAEAVRKHKLRS